MNTVLTSTFSPADGVGRVQDILGGAVVLLQADGAATGVLALEAQNVLDVGPPEAVDGLVVVAHHADVLIAPRQELGQEVLEVVGVLVLVNEDVAELPLVVGPDLLVLLQQVDGVEDDVVEVQGVGLPQAAGVAGVDLRDPWHPPVVGAPGLVGKLLRGLVLVLGVGDDGQHRPGLEVLLVQAHILEDVLDHPPTVVAVVDGEIVGKAQVQPLDIPAENAHAGAVEGGGPDVVGGRAAHPPQPLLQLPGGLVGEGDGDNRPGNRRVHGAQPPGLPPVLGAGLRRKALQKGQVLRRGPVGDKVRIAALTKGQQVVHPVDEDGGLAAAGPGQQQQGPLGTQHRLPLPVIQPPVPPGNDGTAGGGVSLFKILYHM